MTPARVPFRFLGGDAHTYTSLDGQRTYPSISSMLDAGGLVDDTWMTEESAERGTAIHSLCSSYDLGALDPATVVSAHQAYLLSYVAAMKLLRPEILAIEEPLVHPVHFFGGRPDRFVRMFGKLGVLEIKSGAKTAAHRVQLALQAILEAAYTALEPEDMGRWCLYLKASGKFVLEDHNLAKWETAGDFSAARRLIREFAVRAIQAPGSNPFGEVAL